MVQLRPFVIRAGEDGIFNFKQIQCGTDKHAYHRVIGGYVLPPAS
jgi:hypothetical protein